MTPAARLAAVLVGGLLLAAPASAKHSSAPALMLVRTLSGAGNNLAHPEWGAADTPYTRVAQPAYADGVNAMESGPPARYVSNRIFNDGGQNLFSENGVTQWGWVWGQFLDHDFGREQNRPRESMPLVYDPNDPLEQFHSDLISIDFWRNPAAPGTGVTTPREQVNLLSSYIDASNVYGVSASRLDWLRAGSQDGDPTDNSARLLLTPDGYLPRANARGNVANAPFMELDGPLAGSPGRAVVAGDARANENVALTAIQTLFAREHNRIVARLPTSLPPESRFQIARRIVGAEEQYITYNEFLPAMGVHLAPYRGYRPTVDAGLSNEFASVGYRAHSMVNGTFDLEQPAGVWSADRLASFAAEGIAVQSHGGLVRLSIPLDLAFGNPDLLEQVGLGPMLQGLGDEREYRNDEQVDNAMRSILFQVPKPGAADPSICGLPEPSPSCFRIVQDLAATDLQRTRDHGIPSYNALRAAYGLPPRSTFEDVTGEPASSDLGARIDDPSILDFVSLRDTHGNPIPLGSPAAATDAVSGTRRTTLASRLRAIYGDVNKLDALVGMLAEAHVPGTEFGQLQLAIWKRQFERLRDGDRFFYLGDRTLDAIRRAYGISYKHTLADVIRLNTNADVHGDVFKLAQ
jgi:hypothetical protein